MLGFAAQSLGLQCMFLDPSQDPPAAVAGPVISEAFDSLDALAKLARDCDVITYEFENVPVASVMAIEADCRISPPPAALEYAQDRLAEKQLFESLQIPVPGFRVVDSTADLRQAAEALGVPLVVKTRRFGYDGKGQAILRDAADADAVVSELGGSGLIAEQFVRFDREVSAIGVRAVSGQIVTYPLSQNQHREGILRVSRAPAEDGRIGAAANDYLYRLLTKLNYVGVLALELFVCGDSLFANEFAPRVHNSGHWTIEGANVSQFENHIRAVTGMPVVEPSLYGFPGMINIIGTMPFDKELFHKSAAVLHDYGKSQRPGRKLGHATVIGNSISDRDARLTGLQMALDES